MRDREREGERKRERRRRRGREEKKREEERRTGREKEEREEERGERDTNTQRSGKTGLIHEPFLAFESGLCRYDFLQTAHQPVSPVELSSSLFRGACFSQLSLFAVEPMMCSKSGCS